ncbi:MAG: histidinol-phosphate transaminase [Burkholderiaceae bacterium]
MANDLAQRAPDYIRAIAPYQGGRPIGEIARRFGFREDQIVKLASNENPLGMSPKARQAMLEASQDLGRYPDGNGFELKQAIAKKFGLPENTITLGNGSNDILELVAHTFLKPGVESVYSDHSFAVYALATQAVGGQSVVVPADPKTLGNDLSALAAAVTPNTGVIWLANPNNPTGSFLPGAEIRAFLKDLPASVLLVLDEAYTEFLSPADRYNAFDWIADAPNLLISRSFSKAYGLAGLRVGYGVAHPDVTDLLNRVRQPFNVNSLAQAAATAALFDEDFLKTSYDCNQAGLVQLTKGLEALGLGVMPSRGNFVLIDLSTRQPNTKPSDALGSKVFDALLAKGVITRPVGNYGLPNHLRVSIGTAAENEAFLKAMGQVAQTLWP